MKRRSSGFGVPAPIGVSVTTIPSVGAALPCRLPFRFLSLYLLSAMALATAYGSSFFLGEALRSAGLPESRAGAIVSVGILATLGGAAFSGRLAERWGILPLMSGGAFVISTAMACFALVAQGSLAPAYLGGVLLGFGWSVFYVLAPLYLICSVTSEGRLEVLTLLSGSQMLGIGLSAPLGHVIAERSGGPAGAFLSYSVLALAACAFFAVDGRRSFGRPFEARNTFSLTWKAATGMLRTRAKQPVVMICIAACSFSGLSVFQSLYARSRGLDSNTFFLTFTIITVVLRFGSARLVSRFPLKSLAVTLFGLTALGVGVMWMNPGDLALYVGATTLFAAGYGLTYATLNAMVVDFADRCGGSVPAASQVFTLSYFVGAFGFPYVGSLIVAIQGIDLLFALVCGLAALNMALALALPGRSSDANGRSLPER